MAWNQKQNGQSYYYRSRRVGGRVVKQYLGRSPGAHLLAELHDQERLARSGARRAEQELRARLRSEGQALDAVGAAARVLLAAELVLAGLHCHRGQWRRRMKPPHGRSEPMVIAKPSDGLPPDPESLMARLRALTARATAGGPTDRSQLRTFLDHHADLPGHSAGQARQAEECWVALLTEGDALRRECVLRKLARERRELAGDRPGPLESLLVDHLVACRASAAAVEVLATSPAMTPTDRAFRVRQLGPAQRRVLGAARALVALRTLIPAVLVGSDMAGGELDSVREFQERAGLIGSPRSLDWSEPPLSHRAGTTRAAERATPSGRTR